MTGTGRVADDADLGIAPAVDPGATPSEPEAVEQPPSEHRRRLGRRRPRTITRLVLLIVGWALLLLAAFGLVAHTFAWGTTAMLGAASLSRYLMACAPLALLCFASARSWFTAVAAVLTVVLLWLQVPLFIADTAPAGVDVVVMTANLKYGEANPAAVVAAVRAHHVDVLMLEELTAQERVALDDAGLDAALPNSVVDARRDASGVGLWSRLALTNGVKHGGFTFALVSAQLRIPGITTPVNAVATHMGGPFPGPPTEWLRDIGKLPDLLATFSGPTLVGGDFNATPDTRQFRQLLANGYGDATEQAGAGSARTWPADVAFPPLIAIDHVLTKQAVGRSAVTVSLPGSDHRGLLTTVRVAS